MHLTSSPVDWYAARAAGIAAYLLLSGVVSVGILMGGKARTTGWPRFAVEDVHRFGGLLVGSFITLHVAAIAIDSFMPFSLSELAVPFTSHYRPLPMGLGIAAAELLAALAITNHYRARLPYGFWRRAHYLNFAMWTGATVHALLMGTDRSAAWMIAINAACVGTVGAALAWRIGRARGLAWTPATSATAAVFGAAAVAALALGPTAAHPKPWDAPHFSDRLTGRILSQQGASTGIVSMAGNGSGSQPILVRADLLLSTNAPEQTSLEIEYLPSGEPAAAPWTPSAGRASTATASPPTARDWRSTPSGGWRRAVASPVWSAHGRPRRGRYRPQAWLEAGHGV